MIEGALADEPDRPADTPDDGDVVDSFVHAAQIAIVQTTANYARNEGMIEVALQCAHIATRLNRLQNGG